jgi:hypothetical protein
MRFTAQCTPTFVGPETGANFALKWAIIESRKAVDACVFLSDLQVTKVLLSRGTLQTAYRAVQPTTNSIRRILEPQKKTKEEEP